MKVQSSGVHQILYGDHVLIWHLGIHIHPSDDPGATFTIEQEELVLRFCSKKQQEQEKHFSLDLNGKYRIPIRQFHLPVFCSLIISVDKNQNIRC